MNDVFLKALPVLQKLTTAGFEAYFVGGSVRDYLLNRTISDVDIATSAFSEEVKEIFNPLMILELRMEQLQLEKIMNFMK